MKSIILVALALVAATVAAPPESPQILKSFFDSQPEGSYGFSFETENGIARNEKGELKTVTDEDNKPRNVIVSAGSWSYTHPDGQVETIEFTADENGFHPNGPSIPKVVAARR